MADEKLSTSTSSFFKSVYTPSYSPAEETLIRQQGKDPFRPKTMDEVKQDLEQEVGKITSLLDGSFLKNGVYHEPRPLSIEEGKASLLDREKLLKDVERVRDKVKTLESSIDKRIGSESPNTFIWHFKKRPKLRKALKVITGKAKSFVTYEDYKLALSIKAKLEKEGAEEYFEDTVD